MNKRYNDLHKWETWCHLQGYSEVKTILTVCFNVTPPASRAEYDKFKEMGGTSCKLG